MSYPTHIGAPYAVPERVIHRRIVNLKAMPLTKTNNHRPVQQKALGGDKQFKTSKTNTLMKIPH